MTKQTNNYIKFLKSFMFPIKYDLILCFMIMLMCLLAQLYFPMGVQRTIDFGIVGGDVHRLLFEVLIILFVGIMNAVLSFIKYYKVTSVVNTISLNIRLKIMNNLEKLSMFFFSNSKPGAITSIIERDVEQIENVVFTVLSNIIIQTISYIVVINILFALNWKVAVYALIVTPVLAVIQLKIGKIIKKIYKTTRENVADINDFTQEWIENIVDIQLFNYGQKIRNKYIQKQKNNIFCYVKSAKVSGIITVIGQIINTLGVVIILYCGGIDVSSGASTVGMITSLTIYVQKVYSPLTQVMQGIVQVQNASVILDRIYGLIENRNVISNGNIDIKGHLNGNIKVENVSFKYGENSVLKNVNLNINSGEVIGLVGKNGAGKSTVAKLITRLYEPNEGSISVDGIEISKFNINDLRREIIYVQATPYIFPGTIKENILLDKVEDYDDNKLKDILCKVGLNDDIEKMKDGINTLIYSHSTNLSTGQCQKISLARILVKNPSVVILDEPTSSLDFEVEKDVIMKIKNAFYGKTLIIISHRNEALKICNRIYNVENLEIKERKMV